MLIKARDIIIQSLLMYKDNWKLFFKYIGLLFIPPATLALLSSIIKPVIVKDQSLLISVVFSLGYTVLGIVAAVISLWISIALIRTIATIYQNGNARHLSEELADTKPYVWPSIIVAILTALAIFGGMILFVIPGIIIGLWFIFSIYSVLLDDIKKPTEALKRSKELVKGRWWAILWRLVLPWIVFGAIGLIPQKILKVVVVIVSQNLTSGTFLNALTMDSLLLIFIIISLLLTPLAITAKTILYIEMKRTPLPSPIDKK